MTFLKLRNGQMAQNRQTDCHRFVIYLLIAVKPHNFWSGQVQRTMSSIQKLVTKAELN
jgi:hypothetical protein